MGNIQANFESIILSGGTFNFPTGIETGIVTANTIHQIFCLSSGTIIISAMKGNPFTWAATAGQSIDVLVKTVTVSSGTFIGFRAKQVYAQNRSTAAGYQY